MLGWAGRVHVAGVLQRACSSVSGGPDAGPPNQVGHAMPRRLLRLFGGRLRLCDFLAPASRRVTGWPCLRGHSVPPSPAGGWSWPPAGFQMKSSASAQPWRITNMHRRVDGLPVTWPPIAPTAPQPMRWSADDQGYMRSASSVTAVATPVKPRAYTAACRLRHRAQQGLVVSFLVDVVAGSLTGQG